MFNALGELLVRGMEWVNLHWIASYALTIILFTVLFRLISLPFDLRQRKQMARLAEHQPELNKIRERYASNPQTMQQKTREYQKKHNVSMAGGCLPLIFTLLVFTIFLNGMRLWGDLKTAEAYLDTSQMATQEEKEEYFEKYKFAWVHNIWQPDSGTAPIFMSYDRFMTIDFDRMGTFLSQEEINELKQVAFKDEMTALDADKNMSKDEKKAKKAALIETGTAEYNKNLIFVEDMYPGLNNGWYLMAVIAGILSLVTQLVTQKLNPQAANVTPTTAGAAQPTQQQMAGTNKVMMVMMTGIWVWSCVSSNAGFAVYAITSNILGFIVTISTNTKNLHRLFPKKGESKK